MSAVHVYMLAKLPTRMGQSGNFDFRKEIQLHVVSAMVINFEKRFSGNHVDAIS